MSTRALRETLERVFTDALRSIDLRRLVFEALPPTPPQPGKIVLVAAGKAAPAMAAGALDRWGERIAHALVVTTEGTDASCVEGRAELIRAGHPIPDERSVFAAERALSLAPKERDGLLLSLVSGGASSLLQAPPPSLSLDDLREIASRLVRSDLPIQRINTVRRHLSRIHGGRLARAAYPARTLTLFASDVPSGAAHDVGSGPTVPDPTTIEEAREALFDAVDPERAASIARFLTPSLDPSSREAERTEAHALATPTTLARAVAERLRAQGFRVEITAERAPFMHELVEEYAELARALAPMSAIVSPCEPSLKVDGPSGRGGRAGWLALALLPKLPDDVAFLAGASDGVDGSSGRGGACVGGDIEHDPRAIEQALANFDDASAHALLGTSLPGGATGINLTDVHVLARM